MEQEHVNNWKSLTRHPRAPFFNGLEDAKIMFASLGIKFESLIVTAEIVTTECGNNFMVEVKTRRR